MTIDGQNISAQTGENNISVIMVSYHTGAVLDIAINAILEQQGLKELVVVDNGNPPKTLESLRQRAVQDSRLKLITGHGNVGYAAACNIGAKAASGEYLLILNPDAILPEHGLMKLRDAVAQHSKESLACALLLNADGTEQRGGRREILTPQNALAEGLALHRFSAQAKRLNHHQTPPPEVTSEVPAISGSCIMTRKVSYEKLCGMDEQFFLHLEDMDLFYRAQQSGMVMLCVPEVKLVHIGQTSRSASWKVEWFKTNGFKYYMQKHFAASHSKAIMLALYALVYARFFGVSLLKAAQWFMPEPAKIRSARRLLLLYRMVQTSQDQDLTGQHFLLTGATNQVGLFTLGHLLSRGARVTAVQHTTVVPFWHQQLQWVRGDLARGLLDLGGAKPHALVHCAELWLLPPVMHVLADIGIKRLIAFGSTSVFTKVYSSNAKEQQVVDDLEKSEIQAVEFCRKYGVKWTIFRPTMIYGTGIDANITQIADFIRRFGFFMLYPPAKGRRQPVHAEDLAQAAITAIDKPTTYNKAYNLSGGEVLEYHAMVDRIFSAMGKRSHVLMFNYFPQLLDIVGKVLQRQRVNGEMARRMNQDLLFPYNEARADFNYNPRPFLQGGKQDLGFF